MPPQALEQFPVASPEPRERQVLSTIKEQRGGEHTENSTSSKNYSIGKKAGNCMMLSGLVQDRVLHRLSTTPLLSSQKGRGQKETQQEEGRNCREMLNATSIKHS